MHRATLPHPWKIIPTLAGIAALSGCSHAPSTPAAALASFSGERILNHIRVLSSDEFEGRGRGRRANNSPSSISKSNIAQRAWSPAIRMERTCRACRW